MESIAYIYGIRIGAGPIRYVGATTRSLSLRLSEHKYNARQGVQQPVYHWLKSHLSEDVNILLLEECLVTEAAQKEGWWISELDTHVKGKNKGLNCTYGGDGFKGWTNVQISAKKAAIEANKTRQSPNARKIKQMYLEENMSVKDIANALGLSRTAVYKSLKKQDITVSSSNRGSLNGQSKLTEEVVITIRREYSSGRHTTYKSLASFYNVSVPTIQQIINRVSWGHLEETI